MSEPALYHIPEAIRDDLLPDYKVMEITRDCELCRCLSSQTDKKGRPIAIDAYYPSITPVCDRPVYSRFAGPCTAAVFYDACDNLYLLHLLPKAEFVDVLERELEERVGLCPQDVQGGIYSSNGLVMSQDYNRGYRTFLGLTPLPTPYDVLSVDMLVDPITRIVAYHFNYE